MFGPWPERPVFNARHAFAACLAFAPESGGIFCHRASALRRAPAKAMFQAMSELYHNRVLELAADIQHVGDLTDPDGSVLKVSRVCGSTVKVDLKLDEAGARIMAIAVDPKACALGQAATSILTEHAIGATIEEVITARDALKDMLKGNGPPPEGRFWELRHLEPVADYPPRHTSTLLAFEAAVAAIEEALASRGLARETAG